MPEDANNEYMDWLKAYYPEEYEKERRRRIRSNIPVLTPEGYREDEERQKE